MSYNTNYNTNYNSNNQNNSNYETLYPEKSIVLLVHGLWSPARSMQELINTIMNLNPLKSYYNIETLENEEELAENKFMYITHHDEKGSNVFKRIANIFSLNPKANILVKVS